MQLLCTSHVRRRGAARCERLQRHRVDLHRMCQQLAALQGNNARVRLIMPPPPSPHPLLLPVTMPSAVVIWKTTSLQQPCWFKPSVCSQSLIRLTISITELMAFIKGLARSQMGFLMLFWLILHAQIMTVNYSRQLTAFTKRLVILKAHWWSPHMVPLFQPLVPDTARWICWHSAINQWILLTDKGVWQVHAPTAATNRVFKLNLSVISIKEI